MDIRISICGRNHGQEVKRHRGAFCLSPVYSLGNQSSGKRPITQAVSHRVEPRPKSCALKLASLQHRLSQDIYTLLTSIMGMVIMARASCVSARHHTVELNAHQPSLGGERQVDPTPVRQVEAKQGWTCLQESYMGILHVTTHTHTHMTFP